MLLALLTPVLLLLPAGCTEESVAETHFDDLHADISEHVGTVVTVRWTADDGETGEAYVEVETPSIPAVRVDATQDGDEWQAFLFGFKASTEYTYRAVASQGGETLTSEDQLFTTGSPPSSLPSISVDTPQAALARGGYLLTSTISTPSATVIIDMDGDYVWWHQLEAGPRSARHAYMSSSGDSIVLLADGSSYKGEDLHTSILRTVSLDGSQVTELEFEGVHHDFVQLPDGTLAAIQRDIRVLDGFVGVAGETILEIYPDGTTETIWSMWDLEEFQPQNVEDIPDQNAQGNSLDYDPETDTYYMGSRNLGAIFAIDRGAGETLWQLGGDFSDFADPAGETHLTTWQHQFQLLDDGIVVFDNNDNMYEGTRIVEFELDLDTWTAFTRWQYTREEPTFCYALGDVTRFEDGNTLITWSTSGLYEEITPEGEVAWLMSLDLGAGLAYTEWIESLDELRNP